MFRRSLICLSATILTLGGCSESGSEYASARGNTMGTYYALQYATGGCSIELLQVEERLQQINQVMSTYDPQSELSRFNVSSGGNFPVSEELASVLSAAKEVSVVTQGAFDITVGPLVNLWGFGPQKQAVVPSSEQQVAVRAFVGMDKLRINGAAQGRELSLEKLHEEVYVDLSAIAKGYAVDQLHQLLLSQGCNHHMVDIGGEIRVSGLNSSGGSWRIGVEVPQTQQRGVQRVLLVRNAAVATSGDYRNFRSFDGRRVHHVLDPRSGKPSGSSVVSATVVHDTAMFADAYATALMVLSVDEGLRLADAEGFGAYLLSVGVDSEGVPEIKPSYNQRMTHYFVD